MIRALALIAFLVPTAAFAQSNFEPPADMGAAHRRSTDDISRAST